MNRREFLRRFVVSSILVGTAVAGIAELATLIKHPSNSSVQAINQQQSTTKRQSSTSGSSSSSTTQSASSSSSLAGYVYIAAMSALSGKTYAYFNHPTYGNSILVSVSGEWKAFSATCTHRTCTVQYTGSEIYCPCHGGTFNPNNGSVIGGPPPSPLPEFGVQILNNALYVSSSRIN